MTKVLYFGSWLRTILTSVLVVCSALFFLTIDVAAQNRGRPEVKIKIQRDSAGACRYRLDQKEQDNFLIRNGGKISFKTSGVSARIAINRSSGPGKKNKGKRGLSGGQSDQFVVSRNAKVERNARNSFAAGRRQNTRHKIWIVCLDADGNEDLDPTEVGDFEFGGFGGTASLFSPNPGLLGSGNQLTGPLMPLSTVLKTGEISNRMTKRRATGGPEMEVEDP